MTMERSGKLSITSIDSVSGLANFEYDGYLTEPEVLHMAEQEPDFPRPPHGWWLEIWNVNRLYRASFDSFGGNVIRSTRYHFQWRHVSR